MADLSRWMTEQDFDAAGLTCARVERFVEVRRSEGRSVHRSQRSLAGLLGFRRRLGVVPPATSSTPCTSAGRVLERYRIYLVQMAQVRAADRGTAATPTEPLVIDLDATLIIAHSDDKDGASKTYKRTRGRHPLNAYLDRGDGLGESLVGLLRPGNAGANTAVDHITVFDDAVAQLPVLPERLARLVRTDTAGATHDFVDHVVDHDDNWRFSVGFALTEGVKDAIRSLAETHWTGATRQDATPRPGAAVAEITHNDHSTCRVGPTSPG